MATLFATKQYKDYTDVDTLEPADIKAEHMPDDDKKWGGQLFSFVMFGVRDLVPKDALNYRYLYYMEMPYLSKLNQVIFKRILSDQKLINCSI